MFYALRWLWQHHHRGAVYTLDATWQFLSFLVSFTIKKNTKTLTHTNDAYAHSPYESIHRLIWRATLCFSYCECLLTCVVSSSFFFCSRNHHAGLGQEPYTFSTWQIMRDALLTRYSLLPYYYTLFYYASTRVIILLLSCLFFCVQKQCPE